MQIGTVAACLMVVAATRASGAEPEPSTWGLDKGTVGCSFSRAIGGSSPQGVVSLILEPLQTGAVTLRVDMSAAGYVATAGKAEATISVVRGAYRETRAATVRVESGRLIIMVSWPENLRLAADGSEQITVDHGGRNLTFSGMGIASTLEAVRACQARQQVAWGVDTALLNRQGTPPAGLYSMGPIWFTPSNYPADAWKANAQGRSIALVDVNRFGIVKGCRTVVSAGHPSLDEAACRRAFTSSQFRAATDKSGRHIASEYVLSVMWVRPLRRS